jgi:Restriction endonuclease NotI
MTPLLDERLLHCEYVSMPNTKQLRFGIGEWYGKSFAAISSSERKSLAARAISHTKATAPKCPFLGKETPCPKIGGICSLRLYESDGNGSAQPVSGPDGDLRVVCPHRFKQDGLIYSAIGEAMLGTSTPQIVAEVRFLRRNSEPIPEDAESDKKQKDSSEDVGNIDNVLVHPDMSPLNWCALELQAVYFSGEKMKLLFEHIRDFTGKGIPFPDRRRSPDYRSSGPKRLMPQLQIKVPTLRRWGKKMAVVVDSAWFRANVVGVPTVSDLSNCDIAWVLVEFDESTNPITLRIGKTQLQTLERAVEGLTGGNPVTLSEFESKIQEKLKTGAAGKRRTKRGPSQDSGQ